MAATAEFACQWCKQPFIARLADRKRGWARFCSKSCKASKQEFGGTKAEWEKLNPNNRISPIKKYANRLLENDDWGHPLASGFEGHGQN